MNDKEALYDYIHENFSLGYDAMNIIKNIIDWIWIQSMDKTDTINCLMALLDGIGIEDTEIAQFIHFD